MARSKRPRLSAPELADRTAAVEGVLSQIHEEIAALDPAVLRQVLPAIREAKLETERALREWLASHPDGDERFTAQHYRKVLAELREAEEAIRQLDPTLLRALSGGAATAAAAARSHLVRELAVFSARFEGSIAPIPLRAAADLISGKKTLLQRYRTTAKRYAANVQKDIRRQLGIGLLRNETFDQLTRRLVKLGGPRGLVALRGVAGEPGAYVEDIAEGLFRRYNYWAERIVRTEVLEAYNQQAAADLAEYVEEDPRIMARWDASLDRRICPVCRELDGNVAPVGAKFPGGIDHPPAHPNCRCAVIAWRADWEELGAAKTPTGKAPPGARPKAAPKPPPEEASLLRGVRANVRGS